MSLFENWSGTSLLVKSLTPQWSLGARAEIGSDNRRNEDLRWFFAPGVEYNFVPYSESSRRAFTLQALMNIRHWDYVEETVYSALAETRFAASSTAPMNQGQPWGRASISITGSQYLHDQNFYQLSAFSSLSGRLSRGFSVNMSGSYARIHDQLFLPAGDATFEEKLLRQKQLATSYDYFVVFGFSYQFGSIFNNVVNPRFGGGGGRGIIIFG